MPKTYVYSFTENGGVYRPYLLINVTNPIDNVSMRLWALVDTGADGCVFPKFVAEQTKHNLKGDGVKSGIMQGAGENKIETWKHTFKIELLCPFKKDVIWHSKPNLIDCFDHDNAPALLGVNEFLINFRITLNYPTRKIILEIP